MTKESKISITLAISVMLKSKKSLPDLKDSVGPVSPTQKTLEKVAIFLEEIEKEVSGLPAGKLLLLLCIWLAPIKELLPEFWVRVIEVITNLLGRK